MAEKQQDIERKERLRQAEAAKKQKVVEEDWSILIYGFTKYVEVFIIIKNRVRLSKIWAKAFFIMIISIGNKTHSTKENSWILS